jgi:septum formation protein
VGSTEKATIRLILASASPRRRQLLRQAGFRFLVRPSRYHEGNPDGAPKAFARRTALAKADDVAGRLKQPAWVLGADTLVVQDGKNFGKPKDRAEARRMLTSLAGQEHTVVTGVALVHTRTRERIAWVEQTRVRMRHFLAGELNAYLKTEEWRDKAGAYGIQGGAGAFVTQVHGCYFNVVGLPLGKVSEWLRARGIGR